MIRLTTGAADRRSGTHLSYAVGSSSARVDPRWSDHGPEDVLLVAALGLVDLDALCHVEVQRDLDVLTSPYRERHRDIDAVLFEESALQQATSPSFFFLNLFLA